MMTNRRQFVRRCAGSALGLGALRAVPAQAGDEREQPLPIVDTHQHLWDLSKFRLPWIRDGSELDRSFLTDDYLKVTAGLNVVKAVYMEVAVAADQKLAEAEYVVELCRRPDNPTVAAVIGLVPGSDGFRRSMARFKGSPYVKGVRHIPPGSQGGDFLYGHEGFVGDVQYLGELGMSFDLCVPPQRLPEAIRLVDACPGTRFILDHCGNGDPKAFLSADRRAAVPSVGIPAHDAGQWRRDVDRLARRDRVVCKISGIVSRAPKEDWMADDLAPIVDHCLEAFGPDRVMFASDWPVCTRVATLREWVEALKQIVRDRPEDERRKLFAENAVRFYGLEA